MVKNKTHRRGRLCMLFCAILIFTLMLPLTAYADTAVVTTGTMYSYFQTYGSNGVWKDIQTPSHWITSTSEVAYCLQTSMDPPYNSSYSTVDGSYYYNDYVLTGLLAIVQNGYPTTNAGFTDEQARYATANAIRFFLAENYCDGVPQYLNLNVNGDWIRGKSGYEELYEWALYLVELAEWGAANPGSSGSLSFSPSSLALSEDSTGQYFTGQITVNKNISDPYGLAYSLPNGTVINGYTGDRSETLTIKVPTSYENGSYTLCAYGTHTGAQAKLFFWAPSQTNQQRVMTYVLDTTDDYLEAYATITTPSASPKVGSIQITKTDDSSNPLSGVSFELYDEYGNLEGSGQTNSSGILTFSNLELGTYYYKETATLSGYILDSSYHEISVTENGQVARVTVRNSRATGSVVVTKTDLTDGDTLANAHFTLTNSNGQIVAQGDTGMDGRVIFEGIPLGTY
ncbi:MAG: SpaA isopeptide-forming pilin-related protein, partial [Eubacteriales bacterium]|nr:SpaA isopeptide-forming pilin-related protein [Eubacteriales bacterium]